VSDLEFATTDDTVIERRLSPALIGLAVLLAVVGLFLLVVRPLLAGDEPQAAEQPPAVLAAAQEDPPADAEVEPVVADLPLVTYEVFLSRDPFDPVVPDPVPAAATDGTATDGTATDGTATDGTGTQPPTDGTVPPPTDGSTPPPTDGTPPPATGTPPPPAGCSTGETVSCDGRIVALVEVRGSGDDAVAIVQVDTTLYEVRVGDTFAGAFQLSSISGSCVNVLYGDDAFPLCEGDRTLK
jgi:hypothetical protein